MQKLRIGILTLVVLGVAGILWGYSTSKAATSGTVEGTVQVSVCGNNIQEGGETCDGPDFGGETCQTQGFGGGSLACTPACDIDTTSCTAPPPPPPPPPAGSGGGPYFFTPADRETEQPVIEVPKDVLLPLTQINFTGAGSPGSAVILLKDAQRAATASVDSGGEFRISLNELSAGNYIFSLYEETFEGRRSALVTFPISIVAHTTTNVSGIHFVFVHPGEKNISAQKGIDLNEDGRVDLVDFSVLIFWFGKSNPPALIDLNGDGKVDLVDFSVMAYYWTG